MYNKPIEIKVAGRTDKGVSAIGQVCRVRTYKEIQNCTGAWRTPKRPFQVCACICAEG